MIAFVALTVIFLEGSSSSDAVCIVVGMFWSFREIIAYFETFCFGAIIFKMIA